MYEIIQKETNEWFGFAVDVKEAKWLVQMYSLEDDKYSYEYRKAF